MFLSRLLSALVFLTLLAPQCLFAQGALAGGTKENLDLPFDAIGENEEEEDAPEVVTFYGTQLEGDGFFYVIDKSGSMRDAGELEIAKREVIRNITEFSERVQFGVVLFDANVVKFPSSGQPADANPAMKASAIAFVTSTPSAGGSCCQAGLLAALRMSQQASARRKVITYVGDGGGTCQGANEQDYLKVTLATVTGQNYQRAVINTIGVLSQIQEDFLRSLAAANGGTFTRIQ